MPSLLRGNTVGGAGRPGNDDVPHFTVYVTSLVQQANKRKEEYYQSQQSEPADTK